MASRLLLVLPPSPTVWLLNAGQMWTRVSILYVLDVISFCAERKILQGCVVPSDSDIVILRVNLRCETSDVVRSIWSPASWLSEGGFPTTVRRREGRIDWVEFVVIKGVVDAEFLTIWPSDGALLQRDNFGGRNCVCCPIPVWLAKIYSGLLPRGLVNGIFFRDSLGVLLKDLLKKKSNCK